MSGTRETAPEHRVRAMRSLAELGEAITAASAALLAIPDDDRRTAYLCAEPLDAALTGLTALLEAAPEITGLGAPKSRVRESLDHSREELSTMRAEVAAHRAVLDQLMETQEQFADASIEARELRDRIAALERVKHSVAEIPALREAAAGLEADVAALDAADATAVAERLASAVERLALLSEQQRSALSDDAGAMIVRAESAASELSDLRARADAAAAETARHEDEAAQLKAAHGDTLAVLAAWSRADLDLADGMRQTIPGTSDNPTRSLLGELDGITQRLRELDGVLGPLLDVHASAYEEARKTRS
jgi:DNA repair exonuclease SbcCD ATPase subunit